MTTAMQVRDKRIMVNDVELHYREWGSDTAPPLIILHGITGHAWEFNGVAAALAERFHVLAINQRGHGASTWADEYSPAIMADDVAGFIDALDLGRVRIIGHSMGAVNGWWLAGYHQELVERLVILDIDPMVITSSAVRDGMSAALRAYGAAKFASIDEGISAYLAGYPGTNERELRTFAINNLTQSSDGCWVWRFDANGLVQWLDRAFEGEDLHWTTLHQIACPTLIIRAEDSVFTTSAPAERMQREMLMARLVEIPDSGHDIHFDQFDTLMAELWPFLTED